MTRLLVDSGLTPEQQDLAKILSSSSDSLVTLLNDILDFAKIESGRLSIENIPVDIKELITQSLELFRGIASEKDVQLALHIPATFPKTILGDPTRLRQIVNNLLSNAIKFTDEGSVSAEVTDKDAQGNFSISIADSGIGIPADRIDTLFDAFTQADSSTTRRFGGTGLGLAICKKLAAIMGGTISAHSELGQGSRFTLTIPQHVVETHHGSIAVVEGDKTQRAVVIDALHKAGLSSIVFSDLYEFFAQATSEDIDVAAVACSAKEPSEAGVIVRLLRLEPALAALPLILYGDHLQGWEPPGIGPTTIIRDIQRLPAAVDSLSKIDVPETTPEEAQAPVTAVRVLLAEDNPVNQRIAMAFLGRCNATPTLANNGQEALDILSNESFDMIFMDCQMPVLDGFAAAKAIREREHADGSKRTPIIAMTANALSGDRDRCLEAGMDDYLPKPVNLEALNTIVQHWAQPNRKE